MCAPQQHFYESYCNIGRVSMKEVIDADALNRALPYKSISIVIKGPKLFCK